MTNKDRERWTERQIKRRWTILPGLCCQVYSTARKYCSCICSTIWKIGSSRGSRSSKRSESRKIRISRRRSKTGTIKVPSLDTLRDAELFPHDLLNLLESVRLAELLLLGLLQGRVFCQLELDVVNFDLKKESKQRAFWVSS